MSRSRNGWLGAAGMMAAAWMGVLGGCSSVSPSHYVFPRVTGRVLDMESRQPIKDAQVRRVTGDGNARPSSESGGGRLVESASAVRTGADGAFVLKSGRIFGPLGSSGWYSVTLAFDRSGYQTVVRSYTLADSTNAPSGEPKVEAGEILLQRRLFIIT